MAIVSVDKHWLKIQIPSNIFNLIKKNFWIFLSILRIIVEIFPYIDEVSVIKNYFQIWRILNCKPG